MTFSTVLAITLVVLLVGPGHAVTSVVDRGQNGGSDNGGGGILSFELLSGRRVMERRLQEERQRRRDLKGNDDDMSTVQVDALYQGYGTHYVDLWVGTPNPQRQTVIVDTGSSITAFPCEGCHDCGNQFHTDDYFDPSLSQTFRKLSCKECRGGTCHRSGGEAGKDGFCSIHMSYAEGSSWGAYEAEDWLYAGGSHTVGEIVDKSDAAIEASGAVTKFEVPIVFGCQTSLTGLFRTQLADGIMNVVDPAGTGAGAMTVGGTVTRLHKTPMVYASQVTSSRSFFTIYVENIFLQDAASANSNEKSAISNTDGSLHRLDISTNDLNSRGVIVDSGTTDSYFTSRLSKPFREVFEQLSGRKYSNSPMKLSLDEVMTLPAIVFQIRGVANYDYGSSAAKSTTRLVGDMDKSHGNDILVSVPPTHYMEYDDETQSYTPRIYLTESSGSVLGANVMQGHDVFFDLENSRIGFAESDCEYVPLDVTDASGAVEGSKKVQDDVTSPTKVENVDNTDAATATENSDTEGGSVVDGYGMISDSQSATHTDNGVHIMQQCSTNKCRGMAVIAISFIVCAAMLSIRAVRNRRATNAHRGEQGHRIRTNSEDSDTLTFGDADDEDAEEETFHPHSSPIV